MKDFNGSILVRIAQHQHVVKNTYDIVSVNAMTVKGVKDALIRDLER